MPAGLANAGATTRKRNRVECVLCEATYSQAAVLRLLLHPMVSGCRVKETALKSAVSNANGVRRRRRRRKQHALVHVQGAAVYEHAIGWPESFAFCSHTRLH